MRLLWLGAVVLTALLMFFRFPYERVADRIAWEVEARSPWKLQLVDLGPRVMLLGPGVSAGPVRAEHASGQVIKLDQARLRPAWSFSWLWLTPAFYLDLTAGPTEIEGTLTLSDPPHFEGRVVDADLESLAAAGKVRDFAMTGRLDAELALALQDLGPRGPVRLTAREGSLGHPVLPLAIPFDRLDAELELGGETWLTIASADIDSPLLQGQAQGTVGAPPRGPVDVTLDLEPNDATAAMLRARGIRAGGDGRVSLHVTGTTTRPTLR